MELDEGITSRCNVYTFRIWVGVLTLLGTLTPSADTRRAGFKVRSEEGPESLYPK